jgi:hypothetical protein
MAEDLQTPLVEAMAKIAQYAIDTAGFDKTIQATIVSFEDEATGKYKVKYQDSTFYAYSSSIDTKYSKSQEVYINIPQNDMNKVKTIIGAVANLGSSYVNLIADEDKYEYVGSNLAEKFTDEYGVFSYKKTIEENEDSYDDENLI